MVYQKRNAEKLHKIQVIPASESVVTEPVPLVTDVAVSNDQSYNDTQNKLTEVKSVKQRKIVKVDSSNQTELALTAPVASRNRLKQRCFTMNVVPSNNFFFDIADLAERLRKSGVIRTKAQSKNPIFEMINVHQVSPSATLENVQDKIETESNSSTDSIKPIKDFNMSYEPPVFSNYKGGYLGLNSATSRTSSSVV